MGLGIITSTMVETWKGNKNMIIRTMRKITALLVALALTFALLPAAAWAASSSTKLPATTSAFTKGKTLHILAVGNSFSVDGLHYLYQMAKSAGYDVVIGDLYDSGCTLNQHWNNANLNMKVYTYYKVSAATDGSWGKTSSVSMEQALKDEAWDVITFQQSSAVSGVPASYQSVSWTSTVDSSGTDSATVGAVDPTVSEADALEETAETVEQEPQQTAIGNRVSQTITCGVSRNGTSSTFSLYASAQTDLTYTSSDKSVATVDRNGTVTLTGSGTTVVTITAAPSAQYYGATQQVTISSQVDDYLSQLVSYAKKKCTNKKVKFGWHMTWAYAKSGVNKNFAGNYATNYNSDQNTMYRAIVDTVQTTVAGTHLFAFCIPTGTAIQNVRSSYAGDHLNRDGVHLSYGLGRYVAAMTWATALGIDPSSITYRPTGSDAVSPLDMEMIRSGVTDAIQTPWAVTASQYTSKPKLSATTQQTPTNVSSGMLLKWSKVSNATGYRLYRRIGNGSWTKIKTITSGSTTSYTDTAVKNKSGTTYTYSVRAYSGELITAAPARMQQTRLVAPSTTTVTNTASGIKVSWSKVSAAIQYKVYRKTDSGTRTKVAVVSSNTFSYVDTSVKSKNGTSYTYDVVACSKLGESASSPKKTILRLTGVTVKSLQKYGTKLKLTWTQNSKASGYYIYRKINNGSWGKLKTITGNHTLTYADGSVKSGKTYSYRVYACKSGSTSVVSNTKTIKR